MKFIEKTIEDIIWDNIQTPEGCNKLQQRGLNIHYPIIKKRQFKIGNYGVADIVIGNMVWDIQPYLNITIIELKKNKVDIDTLLQGFRYFKGIYRYISDYRFTGLHEYSIPYKINLLLMGDDLKINHDWVYLMEYIISFNDEYTLCIFGHVDTYIYEYQLDGLKFNYQNFGYYLTDEGFDKLNKE